MPTPAPSGKRAGTTALPTVAPCTCDVAKSGSQDDGGGGSSRSVDTLTVVVIVVAVLQQLAIGVAAVMYCQNRKKSGAAGEVQERALAQRVQPRATAANASFDDGGAYDVVATSQTFAPQGGLAITNYELTDQTLRRDPNAHCLVLCLDPARPELAPKVEGSYPVFFLVSSKHAHKGPMSIFCSYFSTED